MVLEINSENFDNEVLAYNGVTVVDFFANWCGPCRKLGPVLDEIATEMGEGVKVVKVNTEENLKIAREYHDGMEASVGQHFDNNIINCIGDISLNVTCKSAGRNNC